MTTSNNEMLDPVLVRERAQSETGKAYQKELEELAFEIQCKQYEIHKLQEEYKKKALEYRLFLGFPAPKEEQNG